MAKLSLTNITSGYQSLSTYNANNDLIEAALENTLSRDGTSPNTMSAALDMNSNKISNLTDGTNNQDAVTVAQLNGAALGSAIVTAGVVNSESATDGWVLTADGVGGAAWEAASGGLVNIVEDTTPQLGGNLDMNGNQINTNVTVSDDFIVYDVSNDVNLIKAEGQTLETDALTFKHQRDNFLGQHYLDNRWNASDANYNQDFYSTGSWNINGTVGQSTTLNFTQFGLVTFDSEIKTTGGTFGGEAGTVIGKWYETGLAADSGMWTIEADGGSLYVARSRADDGTGGGAVFRADRSGTSVTGTLWFADINLNDNSLSKAVLTEYYLKNHVSTPTGTTAALAFTNGNSVELDLTSSTGNVTATLSGIDSGRYAEMIVKVEQHATTPRTVTWEHFGGTIKWPGGTVPTVSTGANAIDIFTFKTWDGGTTIYANVSQDYS